MDSYLHVKSNYDEYTDLDTYSYAHMDADGYAYNFANLDTYMDAHNYSNMDSYDNKDLDVDAKSYAYLYIYAKHDSKRYENHGNDAGACN